MKESIEYPIFNLSYPDWELDTLGDFFIYNEDYRSSDDFFNKYYLNQTFVDCRGNLFKVIGKSLIKSKFRIFRSRVNKIQFEALNNNIDLEQLKKELKEKSQQIKNDAAQTEILKQIENSKTIKELLRGF
ncbi:hypothetical protein LVD17_27265 [Fulvivirga ulvae]|uniref:hypothetical protein n=1 Tax=Fulvivirga ulvae TaxID=2904245 RepID=UPI001F229C4D|nr:hypothetical protein [Fulvivirga ulvae]UII31992.1 hypothetical protein LVD17_27265 [Fulvivirga ulvae]